MEIIYPINVHFECLFAYFVKKQLYYIHSQYVPDFKSLSLQQLTLSLSSYISIFIRFAPSVCNKETVCVCVCVCVKEIPPSGWPG